MCVAVYILKYCGNQWGWRESMYIYINVYIYIHVF